MPFGFDKSLEPWIYLIDPNDDIKTGTKFSLTTTSGEFKYAIALRSLLGLVEIVENQLNKIRKMVNETPKILEDLKNAVE